MGKHQNMVLKMIWIRWYTGKGKQIDWYLENLRSDRDESWMK